VVVVVVAVVVAVAVAVAVAAAAAAVAVVVVVRRTNRKKGRKKQRHLHKNVYVFREAALCRWASLCRRFDSLFCIHLQSYLSLKMTVLRSFRTPLPTK
jgi:hypothetical protein